jgi:prepilin-type N-terminal cleavage/methylation domain-containing protein/prepilin-type processing-associated H-X9-DG protein
MKHNKRRHGFSLIELLVVIGIISLLLGIIMPSLEKAREQANTVRCADHLDQIGQALRMYATENHGRYPRTVYIPGAALTEGTNPAAPDPFLPGGPLPNDVTAPLFLLMRIEKLPSKLFVDPYNDWMTYQPDAAQAADRSNFTDFRKNLGYSYADPYPDASVASAGYQLSDHMNPALPLAACLNPGDGGNCFTHERQGQNVLFADGHVSWETTRRCGLGKDDIYANKAGQFMASPVDATDSLLLPTRK